MVVVVVVGLKMRRGEVVLVVEDELVVNFKKKILSLSTSCALHMPHLTQKLMVLEFRW